MPFTFNPFSGELDYFESITDHVAESDPHTQYQKESERNAASGYCPLDASVLVPLANLPVIEAFKVGGYYFNSTGVNPATELGYGTWVQVAQGLFLVGAP